MRLNNVQTLLNTSDELLNVFAKVETKKDAYKALINHQLKDITKDDFKLDYEFLDSLNSILNTILNICRNHYKTTKNNELILRSSLISNFDNQSFFKTMKDFSLWKKKDSNMVPEFAYSNELVDDNNTYENRVVMSLVKRIELIIKNYDYYYDKKILILENTASKNDFTYGSMFYKQNKALINNLLTNKYQDFIKISEYINKLKKKIKKIESTPFYHSLKSFRPIIGEIIMTNIFKENLNYNKIYRFYKLTNSIIDVKKGNIALTNYVLYLLIQSLQRLGYEYVNRYPYAKYTSYGKNLIVSDKTFYFKNSMFNISIEYEGDIKGYIIDISNSNNENDNSKNLLIPYYAINGQININMSKIDCSSYNNIIIFGYDFVKKYKNNEYKKINISLNQKDYEIIDVLLSSFKYTINALKDIYETMCPICGAHQVEPTSNDIECMNCNNHYSFLNDKLVWIKSIV